MVSWLHHPTHPQPRPEGGEHLAVQAGGAEAAALPGEGLGRGGEGEGRV